MATQRVGKTNGEQKNGSTVRSSEDAKEAATRVRQSKKQKVLREEKGAKVRWLLLAVLLVVAAVGLYYYMTWYSLPSPSKSAPSETSKKKAQATKEGKKQAVKNPPGDKEKKSKHQKKRTSPPKKKPSQPSTEGGKTPEEILLEKQRSRVLRQPIAVDDPDKPHVFEIITGDNLLADGKYQEALERFNAILSQFPQSPRAQFGKGIALSHMAKEKRSNKLMDTAIDFLRMAGLDSILATDTVRTAALVAMADKAEERGKGHLAVRGMEKVVEMNGESKTFANRLAMLHLTQGNLKKAKSQFKKNIDKFEENHFAQAQLGLILYKERRYEQALPLLLEGIRKDSDIQNNGYYYNSAGDCLVRLNRSDEALALYGEAVSLGLFPSMWQRSVFNEPGLRAESWWTVDKTGYMSDITRIEKDMATISRETMSIFDTDEGVFAAEHMKEPSPNYILFSKGKKNSKNCLKVPRTCALLETFPEAAGCKQGVVKLSSLPPHAHISPHTGTTNTKLQVLVGLKIDSEEGLRIRSGTDSKILKQGQIGIIDESFEKEVWHIGDAPAVVLVIDVWHPDLTDEQRRRL